MSGAADVYQALDRSVRLKSGRSFCFSPDWGSDEASILFDRNSGDYWVLAPEALAIVRLLSECQADATSQASVAGAGGLQQEDGSLLQELVQAGILSYTTMAPPHGA